MNNPMSMIGKHILVTGASQGIGRATAKQVAALGAKVCAVARNEDKLQTLMAELEGEGHCYRCVDLSDFTAIEPLMKEIVQVSGKLDGLVHAAGIANSMPLKMTTHSYLDKMFRINFFAYAELLRLAGKKKYSNDGASFVGVSSLAAQYGNQGQTAYAASKGAMDSMLRPVAKELADRKIRVNNVAFSMVDTEIYKNFLVTAAQNEIDTINTYQYMGVIEVADAANAICFLLSDACRYITGTTLMVDGGLAG